MDKNINIAKILKNVPKGTKLWSPICGECKLLYITFIDSSINVSVEENDSPSFTFLSDGRYADYPDAECLLFPSKEHRNWSTFKLPQKHKHFEPYQKVLVAVDYLKDESYVGKIWCADLYGHYDKLSDTHYLVGLSGMTNEEIIPYEGNEYKLGKPVK